MDIVVSSATRVRDLWIMRLNFPTVVRARFLNLELEQ